MVKRAVLKRLATFGSYHRLAEKSPTRVQKSSAYYAYIFQRDLLFVKKAVLKRLTAFCN